MHWFLLQNASPTFESRFSITIQTFHFTTNSVLLIFAHAHNNSHLVLQGIYDTHFTSISTVIATWRWSLPHTYFEQAHKIIQPCLIAHMNLKYISYCHRIKYAWICYVYTITGCVAVSSPKMIMLNSRNITSAKREHRKSHFRYQHLNRRKTLYKFLAMAYTCRYVRGGQWTSVRAMWPVLKWKRKWCISVA